MGNDEDPTGVAKSPGSNQFSYIDQLPAIRTISPRYTRLQAKLRELLDVEGTGQIGWLRGVSLSHFCI